MPNHLLLDLDGTLIDSSPGIFHSFTLACVSLGLPHPHYDEFRHLIGPPVQHIAAALYPNLDPISIEYFRQVFREDYDHASYRMAYWYPGVIDTLLTLSAHPRLRVSIVTNKPTEPAVQLVKRSDLSHCFSQIVGIDYLAVHAIGPVFASKTEALSYVLRSTHSDAAQSLYVGDTPSDQVACCQCKVPFAAVLYGFHRWQPKERPLLCLERFGDLHSLLNSHLEESGFDRHQTIVKVHHRGCKQDEDRRIQD